MEIIMWLGILIFAIIFFLYFLVLISRSGDSKYWDKDNKSQK